MLGKGGRSVSMAEFSWSASMAAPHLRQHCPIYWMVFSLHAALYHHWLDFLHSFWYHRQVYWYCCKGLLLRREISHAGVLTPGEFLWLAGGTHSPGFHAQTVLHCSLWLHAQQMVQVWLAHSSGGWTSNPDHTKISHHQVDHLPVDQYPDVPSFRSSSFRCA